MKRAPDEYRWGSDKEQEAAFEEFLASKGTDLGVSEAARAEILKMMPQVKGSEVHEILQYSSGKYFVDYCSNPKAIDGCDWYLVYGDQNGYYFYAYRFFGG